MSNSVKEWSIEEWKEMFDKINQDCLHDKSDIYVPFTDIECYSEQVRNIIECNDEEVTDDEVWNIAEQLLEMETVRDMEDTVKLYTEELNLVNNIADLVVMYNRKCWAENEDPKQVPFNDYGTDKETIEVIIDHILMKEVVQLVEKKQKDMCRLK